MSPSFRGRLRELEKVTIRDAILGVMGERPGWWWFKSEIARAVYKRYGRVARNEESIYRELRRLVEEGLVEREGQGKHAQYRLKP